MLRRKSQHPQIQVLNNGFKILYFPYKNISSLALNLRIKAGSIYEKPNQIGAAHFTEHMLLSGTYKYPSTDLLKSLILKNGGKIISSTSREDVLFYVKVLENDFENALEFLSQIIQFPIFDENEISKQKSIIAHEINRSLDNPEKYITRLSHKILFPNQRLAQLNTGEISDVNNISRQTLVDFFNENYQAQNCTLSICGNIKNINSVKKLFEKMPSGTLQQITQIKIEDELKIQRLNNSNLRQAHMEIAYGGAKRFTKEDYLLKFIAQALAGTSLSILPNLIKSKKGFAYKVIAESFSAKDFGIFGIYTASAEENLQIILKIIKEGLKYLAQSTLDDSVFEQIKNSIIADIIFSFEKPSALADFYSTCGLYENLKYTHEDEIKLFRQINPLQIQNLAQELYKQYPKITIIAPTITEKDITWNF